MIQGGVVYTIAVVFLRGCSRVLVCTPENLVNPLLTNLYVSQPQGVWECHKNFKSHQNQPNDAEQRELAPLTPWRRNNREDDWPESVYVRR